MRLYLEIQGHVLQLILQRKNKFEMLQKGHTRISKSKYENKSHQEQLENVFIRFLSIWLVFKIEILFWFNFFMPECFVIIFTSV